MSEAIFPSSYSTVSDSTPGAESTVTGGSSEMPMVGFHAIKVLSTSNVANLQTQATNKWVWMPMPPAGVSTDYEQGWDKADASAVGSGVSQLITKLFGKGAADSDSAPAQGNEGIRDYKTVATAAGEVALEKLKGKLGAGQGISSRVLEQAYISYSGPGYRNHDFSFSLKPVSEADSFAISDILDFFKYYSAPQLKDAGGLIRLYDVPHLFNITFHPDNGLFQMMPHALMKVGVQYGGEKYNVFRDTQKPVQTDISLSFKEMRLLDKSHFGDF